MSNPKFIEIDGKRHRWREGVASKIAAVGKCEQRTLFELKKDRRPIAQPPGGIWSPCFSAFSPLALCAQIGGRVEDLAGLREPMVRIRLPPAVSRNELRCDPSPLPGLRISATRETTEGGTELEFRIQMGWTPSATAEPGSDRIGGTALLFNGRSP